MNHIRVINMTQKVLYYVIYGVGIDLVKAIAITSIISMVFEILKCNNLGAVPPDSAFLALILASFIFGKVFKYSKLYDENKFYIIPYVVGEIILLAIVLKPLNASLPTETIKDSIPLFVAITLTHAKNELNYSHNILLKN